MMMTRTRVFLITFNGDLTRSEACDKRPDHVMWNVRRIRTRNAKGFEPEMLRGSEPEMLRDSNEKYSRDPNQKCWGIRPTNVGVFRFRHPIFLITTTAEVSKTNPLRSWIGHCCSGGCHLPTIHRRTQAARPAVLHRTQVTSQSCQRTSSSHNRQSIDSLHTPRFHDYTWDDLPLSHPSPPQSRTEGACFFLLW